MCSDSIEINEWPTEGSFQPSIRHSLLRLGQISLCVFIIINTLICLNELQLDSQNWQGHLGTVPFVDNLLELI